MKNRLLFVGILLISILLLTVYSCKGKKPGTGGTVVIREMGDPDMLNPINHTSSNARVVIEQIFMNVNAQEIKGDYNLLPVLTKELGKVSEINEGEWNGGMKLEYEIRDEAVWDNGSPITGSDYAFTIKCILNPKTNCEHLKSYYGWIGDIVVDSANPKKFTVFSNKKYFKIEEFAGGYVIPEYNYDPNHIMQKFSIRDMNTDEKRASLKSNPDIQKFADEFNSEKYQRDPNFISGFGPYKLESWTTGQEIVLKRKDSWWGDKFKDLRQFWAYPKKFKFKVINDQNTAITALKDGQIDAFEAVPPKDYHELIKNKEFTSKFRTEIKDFFAYSFLVLNLRKDKFKDIKVRQALAHAVDRKKINEVVNFGENILTESFIHPKHPLYQKDLVPNQFDLTLSNKLLDEAGWKDTDGDGIRDKVINGKKVQFSIEYKYNSGNELRKNAGLIIQADFKKIGIQMEIVAKEWTVFLQEQDKRQFEMMYSSLTGSGRPSDPKQTLHSSNAGSGGHNTSGWGTPESDQVIDALNQELDANKRAVLYAKIQKMIHDDIPVIYLFAPVNRIAINRKFEVETHSTNPGYTINEFRLAK